MYTQVKNHTIVLSEKNVATVEPATWQPTTSMMSSQLMPNVTSSYSTWPAQCFPETEPPTSDDSGNGYSNCSDPKEGKNITPVSVKTAKEKFVQEVSYHHSHPH